MVANIHRGGVSDATSKPSFFSVGVNVLSKCCSYNYSPWAINSWRGYRIHSIQCMVVTSYYITA